jgi:hypothetical protein
MRIKNLPLLVAVLLAPLAFAQDGGQGGVLVYQPAYFTDARPNTAYDMINRLPGFNFDGGASARGFAGTAGNVLIDGHRPTAKTDNLYSILTRIPAADVDHIEVIRGGTQGIDMQGQSVVANVVRKKADSTQIVVDIDNNFWPDGHMVPDASVQFTRRVGDETYEASIFEFGNFDDGVGKGIYTITDTAAGTVTRYDLGNKGMGLGWGATGAATLALWGGQFKANFTFKDSPFGSTNFYDAPGNSWSIVDNSSSKKGEIGLHWNGPVGGAELETLFLQRLGRSSEYAFSSAAGDNELYTYKATTAESIGRATLRYRLDDELTLETGAEGAYNLLDGTSAYAVNGTAVALPSADARVDEIRAEAFAQTTWSITPSWKLEVGSRFEYSRIGESGYTTMSRSFFYAKPRALLTWTPAKDTQIRLRYERVLGQLEFSNFVASSSLWAYGVHAGNPNIEPDRHSQFELSFQQDFWERGSFVLTLTHEDISGVMDYIPVTGSSGTFDAPGNIGAGHKNVLDAEMTLPLDRLGLENGRLQTTTIWRLSGVRDPATGTMRTISGLRPRNFNFTLSQDVNSLKSTWSIFFFSGWDEKYWRPTQFEHAHVVPPYIELQWDYKPSPKWMVSVALRNPIPFSYEDVNESFPGLRGSVAASRIADYRVKSQARLFVEIRWTP